MIRLDLNFLNEIFGIEINSWESFCWKLKAFSPVFPNIAFETPKVPLDYLEEGFLRRKFVKIFKLKKYLEVKMHFFPLQKGGDDL